MHLAKDSSVAALVCTAERPYASTPRMTETKRCDTEAKDRLRRRTDSTTTPLDHTVGERETPRACEQREQTTRGAVTIVW
eukprot:3001600-Rhodomonas_salina.1